MRRRSAGGVERYRGDEVDSPTEPITVLPDCPNAAGRLTAAASFVRQHDSAARMGDTHLRFFDLMRAGAPARRLFD